MTEAEALLDVRALAKHYGSVAALREADLSVQPGQIHALLGANGAGKSTLVKTLAGVVPADAGSIRLRGRPLLPRRPVDALRAGIATVFQDPAFAPDLTIGRSLRLAGIDRTRLREWAAPLGLERLDLDLAAKELPLPVLRMLDLARALSQDPHLLVLDEITAALPGDQVELVFATMAQWRSRGRSVLFISHRLREVLRMCDEATILRDGRTVAVVVPGEGGEKRLVEPMLGETVAQAATAAPASARPAPAAAGPVVLAARELTSRDHLRGVSLQLRAGEILGLVALEGQGQDRLFEVLSGDRPYDGGELSVNGKPVRPRSPYDQIRNGVVLVPADRLHALLPRQSVRHNLAAGLYNRLSRWFGLARDEKPRVDRSIQRLAIDTRAQRQVRRLSGGNQQKVAVGRWLTAGFRTLLCHDPTRGIDIGTKEQIYALLRELAGEGAAILYYTSELTEVPLVCERVLVMYGGTIVRELPSAEADEATLLNAAHGLAATDGVTA